MAKNKIKYPINLEAQVATFHSTILKTIIMIYIEVTYKVDVIVKF